MSLNFIEQYTSPNKTNLEQPSQSQLKNSLISSGKHQHVNMDDTESEEEDHEGEYNAEKPWLTEWSCYEKTHEAVPDSMGIV